MCRAVWTVLLVLSLSACSHAAPRKVPQSKKGPARVSTLPSSHGSGKLPCVSTKTVRRKHTNYTYCVAKVAGAELKIIEPQDVSSSEPLRLAIFLHGDGAFAHDSDMAPRLQAPWTYRHHTLYVSARAPNSCSWWTKPKRGLCVGEPPEEDKDTAGENAEALVRIIEALRHGWNIVDGPILFGGSSGGSVFLTGSFLPKYGDRYPGVYALNCGGEVPWGGNLSWNSTDPALRGPTKLFFTFGSKDPLRPDILAAIAYYQEHSFPLDEKVVPGADHCAFDHLDRVVQVWSQYTGQ